MEKISYPGYRFPPEIIHQAIWLYLRFTLSLRDVEDLLAERGVAVSYETVRRWVNHFGPMIAADLRKRRLESPLASRDRNECSRQHQHPRKRKIAARDIRSNRPSMSA
jgi:transposase-like protein